MNTYFFANPEHCHKIYGSIEPACIDIAEIIRLAGEWDMEPGDLLKQFHVASLAEIDCYGIYNSDDEPTVWTVQELIDGLQKCPKDYTVMLRTDSGYHFLAHLGIDPDEKTVDLFPE